MSSMNDLEQCCLIPAIEKEINRLISSKSTWVEGEGLSKGEDRSGVRPPPEPPPRSDRDARVKDFKPMSVNPNPPDTLLPFFVQNESFINGECDENEKMVKTAPRARKNMHITVAEPQSEDGEASLKCILEKYLGAIAQRVNYQLGYQLNIVYDHYATLAPLMHYHLNNCGDPFMESFMDFHSKDFEVAVLDWFAQLWEIEKDKYWGYITNGGTEGNLHGILLGREVLPNGILYASKESHYSVFKAAKMYRMEFEGINTMVNGEMDYADLKSKLLQNKGKPAIINATIGTSFKGAMDNLDIIIETVEECGYSEEQIYIHCDAALSGLIVPFLKNEPKITFKKPMIGSITISGHKFLGCPMPCGIQITRKRLIYKLSRNVEYIASVDATISGSRNGLTPICLWYSLSTMGRTGLQSDAQRCIKNAEHLSDRLRGAGISTMHNRNTITVVFERPRDREFIRHWQLSCVGEMAHVIVMPGVTSEALDRFFNDLVHEREMWYVDGKIQPPCLIDDFGPENCNCPLHKI